MGCGWRAVTIVTGNGKKDLCSALAPLPLPVSHYHLSLAPPKKNGLFFSVTVNGAVNAQTEEGEEAAQSCSTLIRRVIVRA